MPCTFATAIDTYIICFDYGAGFIDTGVCYMIPELPAGGKTALTVVQFFKFDVAGAVAP